MVIIRPARVEDATAMAHVIVNTYLAAHQGQIPEAALDKRRTEWTYDESAKNWRRYLQALADGEEPLECVYVAEAEAPKATYPQLLGLLEAPLKLVGVATAHPAKEELLPNAAEISSIYILEEHQGAGIGRQLMQAVATHMQPLGLTALLVGVLTANAPARSFYEALGGVLIGQREFDEEGILLPEVIYGWPDISELRKPYSTLNTQHNVTTTHWT